MKLIIHGGFFSESLTNQEVKKAKQDALQEIAALGYEFLKTHTATQTVCCLFYTVALLEDCDLFNAGTGRPRYRAMVNIRLSAALMDGNTQKFSGVINVERC